MDMITTMLTGLNSLAKYSDSRDLSVVLQNQTYPVAKPGLGPFTSTSASKAVEPVFKGLEAPVTPANNATNLFSGYGNEQQELLLRKIKVAGVDKKYLETLEHIVNSEKLPISDIPHQDLMSMLRALKFSEVSLDDQCFDKFNIKIIKTGAVIFTWYAPTGISIFNGTNNCYQLNYVKEIMEAAKHLEKKNKPVIIVYSNFNLGDESLAEMRNYFFNGPNIITLCIETDLGLDCIGFNHLARSDSIRLQAISHQMKVIDKAIEKAEIQPNKKVAHNNLLKCKELSFIYSDMDNLFKQYPKYILAFDGVIDAQKLQVHFEPLREKYPLLYSLSSVEHGKLFIPCLMEGSLTDEENMDEENMDEENIAVGLIKQYYSKSKGVTFDTESHEYSQLTKWDIFKKLSRMLPSIIIKRRKIIRTHLQSGSLQDELDKLKDNPKDIALLKHKEPERMPFSIFRGEKGLLGFSSFEHDKFTQLYADSAQHGVLQIAFHDDNESDGDRFGLKNKHFFKANYLLGYQLINSILIGHNLAWSPRKEYVLTCFFENGWFLIKTFPHRIIIERYGHNGKLQDSLEDIYFSNKRICP